MKSNTETNLEIFGSYENSLTESKVITGYNKVKYVVGGNARYATRSNVLDWNAVENLAFGEVQIRVINDILHFPEYISDRETIYELLQEIIKLPVNEFLKLLENSLNLKEALIIQLRRLFYTIDKMNTTNELNSITPNYVRPTEFCPYEPSKRIIILLNQDYTLSNINYKRLLKLVENNIKPLQILKEKKATLFKTNIIHDNVLTESSYNKIKNVMDAFIKMYTRVYDILHKIENINVEIAQNLEKMLDGFDQELVNLKVI